MCLMNRLFLENKNLGNRLGHRAARPCQDFNRDAPPQESPKLYSYSNAMTARAPTMRRETLNSHCRMSNYLNFGQIRGIML